MEIKSKIIIVSTAIAGLVLGSSNAEAMTVRHCNARYELEVVKINGVDTPYAGPTTISAGVFGDRCGDAVPDRCRRRARNHALTCMNDHMNVGGEYKPMSCTNNSNTYSITDLKGMFKERACSWLAGEHGKHNVYTIQVVARTSGDRGCGGHMVLTRSFILKCGD